MFLNFVKGQEIAKTLHYITLFCFPLVLELVKGDSLDEFVRGLVTCVMMGAYFTM
jgi:hypothetical protein